MDKRSFLALFAAGLTLPGTVLAHSDTSSGINRTIMPDRAAWFRTKIAQSKDGKVELGEGVYRFDASIDITGLTLTGVGTDRTVLLYEGPADEPFLSIRCSDQSNTSVCHLTLVRVGEGGTAISVSQDNACYFNARRRLIIDDVVFRGSTVTRGVGGWISQDSWQCCISLGDTWGTYLSRIDAIGGYDIAQSPTQRDRSVFLRSNAKGGIMSARLSSITAASFYRAVELGARTFFFIDQCDFAACYDGLISVHEESAGFSEGKIVNSLINAQHIGLHFRNTAWREISGVSLSRHKKGYKKGDWVGIYLEKMQKCWIDRVRFQVDVTDGTFDGNNTGLLIRVGRHIMISNSFFGYGLNCSVKEIDAKDITMNANDHYGSSNKLCTS